MSYVKIVFNLLFCIKGRNIYICLYIFILFLCDNETLSYPNKREVVFLLNKVLSKESHAHPQKIINSQELSKVHRSCATASEPSPLKMQRPPAYLGSLGQNKTREYFSPKRSSSFSFQKCIFFFFTFLGWCLWESSYLLIVPVANFLIIRVLLFVRFIKARQNYSFSNLNCLIFLTRAILSNVGFLSKRYYGHITDLVHKTILKIFLKTLTLLPYIFFLWLNCYDFKHSAFAIGFWKRIIPLWCNKLSGGCGKCKRA